MCSFEIADEMIPESERMAEKLGLITLCKWCGKRIEPTQVMRMIVWSHIDSDIKPCAPPDKPNTHLLGRTHAEPRTKKLKTW